ncbi:MAG TPA: response regulator transcription factor [Pyrinomonadaceae bacterium]|nr:response regulator transcription factor [Pyrinomonadaceae bacterium]
MKLLIVEDNSDMRRLIRQFVGKYTDEVFECTDGSEALTFYKRHRPDWVLMDIEMNHTDGISATRQIKAAFPDARVVIVTNHNTAALREEAQAAGAQGYVLKENLAALKQWLAP